MISITCEESVRLLGHISQVVENSKGMLTELDSAIGDGDLGISLELGFHAIEREGSRQVFADCGEALKMCASSFADWAPSTIGALLATGFGSAARIAAGKTTLDGMDVSRMLGAAIDDIKKRGNAQVGDKTLLDALTPAFEAIRDRVTSEQRIDVLMGAAALAAETGAEATKLMRAAKGRSRWLQGRTVGHIDPGAAAVALILRACAEWCGEQASAQTSLSA